MFPVLALSVLLVAHGASPADNPTAPPAPVSTPYTTVTPAPLPGTHTVPAPTQAPTPSPTPLFDSFASVKLGDSPDIVRKNLGKPLEVDPVNIGEMWRYYVDGGNARLAVIFSSGATLSVTLSVRDNKKSTFADPYGVVLGMSVDQLTSLRGQPVTVSDGGNRAYGDLSAVRWVYGFDSGQITDINLSEPVRQPSATTTAPAALSAIDLTNGHDGSSAEHAIIINATSTEAGIKLEKQYIGGLTCGQSGTWSAVAVSTVAVRQRWVDEFNLVCSTDRSAQTLYFDVRSYAGSQQAPAATPQK
ncbi:MAG TPA: hypothetical protein VJN22_01720 [Candidatus Eremiobacteraceae bacterium]|nr:hypothetical protein [Candidatus Eremiobacteraceae bacterium]